MRITQAQFDAASNVAFDAAEASPDEVVLSDRALIAFAAALDIYVCEYCDGDPNPCRGCGEVSAHCHCRSGEMIADEEVWAVRTIADVVQGDVVRPAGAVGQEATVTAIGPPMEWHVDDITDPRGAQYRPHEHALTYSVRNVTLAPLAGGPPFTPPHGMRLDFAVEIRTTPAEIEAIELLGGWGNRRKALS